MAISFDPYLLLAGISCVVLLAYMLDLVGRKLHVPAVVMMLAVGFAMRQGFDYFDYTIPNLKEMLTLLGTIGLILIVLEGALDLEISRAKIGVLVRSSLAALLGIVVTTLVIAYFLRQALAYASVELSSYQSLLLATPFAVISSAIAIPSVATYSARLREFVIYETSLADIIGVMLFYALISPKLQARFTANDSLLSVFWDSMTLELLLGFGLVLLVGFVFSSIMYVFVNRIEHHVKFLPMIFAMLLLYVLGKMMHLSPLLLIMVFGLAMNNAKVFKKLPLLKRVDDSSFDDSLKQFKHITAEFTFIVRTFFFVLLGYFTELPLLLDEQAWILCGGILACIYLTRAPLMLAFAPQDAKTLSWIGPRGLVTVLLFFSIPESQMVKGFPLGTLMLVVISAAFIMTFGLMRFGERAARGGSKSQAAGLDDTSLQQASRTAMGSIR